jgi:drug/metabolite transporter (DMT)-like permease
MIIEVSLIFAFAAMFCWGFGDFFIQKCARKIGDLESLAFIGIIGAIIILPFAIKDFNLISTYNLLLLLVVSIVTFIAALFNFEALKEGKISIIDVIIELELPTTIILGFIFFRESLTSLQFLIIFFIFIGIILAATKSFSHWKQRLEKGALLAFFAAIGMGFVNFLMAKSARDISPSITILGIWIITALFSLFFIWKREGFSKLIKNSKKFKCIILAMGIFDTLAWTFYILATSKNEISIITAITESYPAIALLLGVWINREKIRWYQWAGAGIALIASFILAFSI